MSLDADTIVDRRRMRRKLTFWRVVAIVLAIGTVVVLGAALRAPGTALLTGRSGGAIARVPSPVLSAAMRSASRRCSGWRNRGLQP